MLATDRQTDGKVTVKCISGTRTKINAHAPIDAQSLIAAHCAAGELQKFGKNFKKFIYWNALLPASTEVEGITSVL